MLVDVDALASGGNQPVGVTGRGTQRIFRPSALARELDKDAALRMAWRKGFVVSGVSWDGLADAGGLEDDVAFRRPWRKAFMFLEVCLMFCSFSVSGKTLPLPQVVS